MHLNFSLENLFLYLDVFLVFKADKLGEFGTAGRVTPVCNHGDSEDTSLCKEDTLSGRLIHSHQPLSLLLYNEHDWSLLEEDREIKSLTRDMLYCLVVACCWVAELVGGGGGVVPMGGAGNDGGLLGGKDLNEELLWVTAGEGREVTYLGGPEHLRWVFNTEVLKYNEEGVGWSLMGVALSVGWPG